MNRTHTLFPCFAFIALACGDDRPSRAPEATPANAGPQRDARTPVPTDHALCDDPILQVHVANQRV